MNDNLFFPQFDFEKKLTICAKQQLLEMHLINYSKTSFDLWTWKYRYLEVNTQIVCTMFSKIIINKIFAQSTTTEKRWKGVNEIPHIVGSNMM